MIPPCGLTGVILHGMPPNGQLQQLKMKPRGGPEFLSGLPAARCWEMFGLYVSDENRSFSVMAEAEGGPEAVFDVNILRINPPAPQ